jgi:hypothetical protein
MSETRPEAHERGSRATRWAALSGSACFEGVPTVRFPQPFKQVSGKRALVMERVHYKKP